MRGRDVCQETVVREAIWKRGECGVKHLREDYFMKKGVVKSVNDAKTSNIKRVGEGEETPSEVSNKEILRFSAIH